MHPALLFVLGGPSSLDIAMYAWTDPQLNALVTQLAERCSVRLTLDSSQFKDDDERQKLASTLNAAGVDFSIGTSKRGAIMHLKSGVIDGTVIFTGSTNWSDSGEEKRATA